MESLDNLSDKALRIIARLRSKIASLESDLHTARRKNTDTYAAALMVIANEPEADHVMDWRSFWILRKGLSDRFSDSQIMALIKSLQIGLEERRDALPNLLGGPQ